jgi:hypothetical protein
MCAILLSSVSNAHRYMCVSFAVSTNNGEMVQMLLENGADIDAEDDEVCKNIHGLTCSSLSPSLYIF